MSNPNISTDTDNHDGWDESDFWNDEVEEEDENEARDRAGDR